MKKSKINYNYYFIYTILFGIIISGILICFIKANKSLLWPYDGLTIQYPALSYLGRYIRSCISNGQFNFFDFHIGMGTDVIQFLGMWYLDPVAFLSVLVPSSYSEILYNCLTILRFYLIGISFLLMCKHFKIWNVYALVGSMVYTFSGYTYYFIKHPVFFWGLIYMPLLIIGTDKLITSKKMSFRFILLIAVSFITGYQLLYMNTFFLGVFLLIRYFSLYGFQKFKNLLNVISKFIATYILGVGLTGVIALPILHGFLTSNRTQTLTHIKSLWTYGKGWLCNLIAYMFVPNKDTGYWLYNGYAIITFIALTLLFLRGKRYLELKFAWCTIFFLFLIPICTYILFGFNMLNHRWSYIYGLLMAIITALILPEISVLESKNFIYLIMVGLLYTLLILFNSSVRNTESLITCILYWISLTVFMIANSSNISQRSFGILTMGLTAIVCVLNGYITFSPEYGNYVSEFSDCNTANSQLLNSSANLSIDDDTFYRREAADNQRNHLNTALLGEYNGISICSNELSSNLFQFVNVLENKNYSLAEIYDLDNRTFLETLCGVKYFTIYEGQENYLPYGFSQTPISASNGALIYKNSNFLPIGFTYKSILNDEDYKNYTSYEKQAAMLQGVTLVGADDIDGKYSQTKVSFDYTNIPYKKEMLGYAENEGKTYHIYEAGASIKFSFEGINKAETYIRIKGFNTDKLEQTDINVPVSTNTKGTIFTKNFNVRNSSNQYTSGNNDFLINLGYYEEALNEITLSFPETGDYIIDNIEIICQPMGQYKKSVEILLENVMENVYIGNDKINGKIDLSEDKILFFYIPYSSGWKAFIDGKETKIYKANEMFMGLPLLAGSHKVELEYTTPWLKLGGMITLTSCSICVFILLFQRFSKKLYPRKGAK